MILAILKDNLRLNHPVLILTTLLISSFSLLVGCTFGGSGGLGTGLPTNLGGLLLKKRHTLCSDSWFFGWRATYSTGIASH